MPFMMQAQKSHIIISKIAYQLQKSVLFSVGGDYTRVQISKGRDLWGPLQGWPPYSVLWPPVIHGSLKCKMHSLPPKSLKVAIHFIINLKARILSKSGPRVHKAPRYSVLNAALQVQLVPLHLNIFPPHSQHTMVEQA